MSEEKTTPEGDKKAAISKTVTPTLSDTEAYIQELEAKIKELEGQLKAQAEQPAPILADGKRRWRKLGGGTFRMANGKIIKQNQVFEATTDEIPIAFRDSIVPIDGEIPIAEQPALKSSTKYELRTKGVGWFDVINTETTKPINEVGLRKEAAEKLLQELS